MSDVKLTKAIARKVLETVDAGLVKGVGNPVPGKMCVEAAVCYALGEKHGDNPSCVSSAVRALKMRLNDSNWSSNKARAKGLRRLAIAQLGTKGVVQDKEFAERVADIAIRKVVPKALRIAAEVQKDPKHRDALRAAAVRCEKDGTKQSALDGRAAAEAAAYAAAEAAACVAEAAAEAAMCAAEAAECAAYAAAEAAACVAEAAAEAAMCAAEKRDKIMSDFAEEVAQLLIELKAPGCEWLDLTEDA